MIFTISPYLLPRLIPALRILAPDMPLILEENYTSRLSEMLKRGEVDAIIVADPFEEAGTVACPCMTSPSSSPRQGPSLGKTGGHFRRPVGR